MMGNKDAFSALCCPNYCFTLVLLCNFVEITLRHGCSPVNLLDIFRTLFPKNTSGGLLLVHSNFPLLYPLKTWESQTFSAL